MTLIEYIESLNTLIKNNPIAASFEVIYSSDDEGNNYQKVWGPPTICQVNDLEERNLDLVGMYDEDISNTEDEEYIDFDDCNAVIIN